MSSLAGKTVAITGGFGALGRAVALEAIDAGARVALLGRGAAPADLPAGAIALANVDVTDMGATKAAFERVGGIDGLVNTAGGFEWETLEQGALETWDRMYEMNVRTALQACRAALPGMLARGGGRIVNVGALSAEHAAQGMGAYAAAKSGVARLTEAIAEEYKDRGIACNAVLPSIIDTPANRKAMPDADFTRWVDARALARVIVFLLSDDAAPVTGALLPVRGRG
jgi:NAD(P)-dependent dehydrogenase (short-subunit alcohol dehydrogenase family)